MKSPGESFQTASSTFSLGQNNGTGPNPLISLPVESGKMCLSDIGPVPFYRLSRFIGLSRVRIPVQSKVLAARQAEHFGVTFLGAAYKGNFRRNANTMPSQIPQSHPATHPQRALRQCEPSQSERLESVPRMDSAPACCIRVSRHQFPPAVSQQTRATPPASPSPAHP